MRAQTLLLTTFLALTSTFGLTALPADAQTPLPLVKANVEDGSTRTIVIRRPGSYFLVRDILAAEELAIDIRTDDVTIDLRGYSIVGLGDKIGTGISIAGVSNVAVFGGKIRDFGIGVKVEDSTNVRVSDLQILGEDLGGSPPDVEIGVLVLESRGVEVRDNVISNTFLGVFVRGGGSGGNRITSNLIAGKDNGELAICYNPAPDAGSAGPSGDVIADNVISRFRRGFSFSTDSTGNVLKGNSFAYFDLGIVQATADSNVIRDNDEIQIAR